MAKPGTLKLEVQRVGDWPEAPGNKALKRWVRAALKGRRGRVGLLIRLVDAEESAHLNQTYRGKAGPTNVLAFPSCRRPGRATACWGTSGDLRPGGAGGGDGAGQALLHHLAHLARVSHLLGYDHMNGAEAARGAPGTQDPSGAGHPGPLPGRTGRGRHRRAIGSLKWVLGLLPWSGARPFPGPPLAHPRASALIAGAPHGTGLRTFDLSLAAPLTLALWAQLTEPTPGRAFQVGWLFGLGFRGGGVLVAYISIDQFGNGHAPGDAVHPGLHPAMALTSGWWAGYCRLGGRTARALVAVVAAPPPGPSWNGCGAGCSPASLAGSAGLFPGGRAPGGYAPLLGVYG